MDFLKEEQTCLNCKWWTSFQSYYHNPLEPYDCGHCSCKENKYLSTEENFTCEFWKEYI